MPVRKDGDRQAWIQPGGWESHVDKMIREAQARGEFDNLPGAGKPLDLGPDTPFGAEWQSAFRIAKNAGAAPLWVELDKEIGADGAALRAMLDRCAVDLRRQAGTLRRRDAAAAAAERAAPAIAEESGGLWRRLGRRLTTRTSRQPAGAAADAWPRSLEDLEAERQRARALYLKRAAELDQKIQEYNAQRPRALSWLEKPRLLPQAAAAQFDQDCPALAETAPRSAATGAA